MPPGATSQPAPSSSRLGPVPGHVIGSEICAGGVDLGPWAASQWCPRYGIYSLPISVRKG